MLNLFGFLMCLVVLAVVAGKGQSGASVLSVVGLVIGALYFFIQSVFDLIDFVSDSDMSNTSGGKVVGSAWQIATDILWFLAAIPFSIGLALAPFFILLGGDAESKDNRLGLFFGWLFVLALTVVWNFTPEARQVTFGPLYRLLGWI